MGYGHYVFEDGIPRGYTVEALCDEGQCSTIIDRGLSFLCYSCTKYFCGKHLRVSEKEYECFAGSSDQICVHCINQQELGEIKDVSNMVRIIGRTLCKGGSRPLHSE